MSWSDHKDDKSRFDGWREFLNEGKESAPSHMSTKLRDATLGIGYRSANNTDKLAAIHYIRKHAHEVPNSPVSKKALEDALASGNPDVIEAHAAKVDALDKATLERYHSRAVGRRDESFDDEDYLKKTMAEIHEASPTTSSRYYAGPETDPQKVTPLSLPESQLQQIIKEELSSTLSEGDEEAMDPRALRDLISHILDPSTDMNDVQQALKSTVLSAVMEVAKSVYRDLIDGPRRAMIRGIIEEVADPDPDNIAESEQMLALEMSDTGSAGDEVGGMSLEQKKKQCAEDEGTWEDGHCNKAKAKPLDPMLPPAERRRQQRRRKLNKDPKTKGSAGYSNPPGDKGK